MHAGEALWKRRDNMGSLTSMLYSEVGEEGWKVICIEMAAGGKLGFFWTLLRRSLMNLPCAT